METTGLFTLDRKGARYGPYSVAEIHTYLSQGLIRGTDLVWTDGMAAWITVNQLIAAPAARSSAGAVPAGANPIHRPVEGASPLGAAPAGAAPVSPAMPSAPTKPRFWSYQGRVGRARYFWVTFAGGIVTVSCQAVLGVVAASQPDPVTAGMVYLLTVGAWVTAFVAMVLHGIKRFHDLDRPGTHWWFLVIPLYGLYVGLVLLFTKGTTAPNRYGPDPLAPRA